MLTLLKEAMLKNTEAKGFLIDGYPRELEQGTRFEAEVSHPTCYKYNRLKLVKKCTYVVSKLSILLCEI